MKKLKYIFPAIALFLVACDSNDDGFYNTEYLESQNSLVNIETQPTYNVNDVLYIEAAIPKLLQQTGQSNLLDIRQSTGNAPTFEFAYLLERRNAANTWDIVDVSDNFIPDLGNANTGSYVQAFLQYNSTDEEYIFRGGIQLVTAGEYRISFITNSSTYDKITLRSNSINNNVILNIFSPSLNLDASGYYTFTVN